MYAYRMLNVATKLASEQLDRLEASDKTRKNFMRDDFERGMTQLIEKLRDRANDVIQSTPIS